MKRWAFSKLKSWLYWSWMLFMIFMIRHTQGDCIEEEREALLEIKASHMKFFHSEIDHFLPTWADYGSDTPEVGGNDCCDWERVNCNMTTGHVTELSLYNLRGVIDINYLEFESKLWPLNVSLFLHFKELRSLNLSYDDLDKEFMKTGLGRLSSLKKLEVLDLSSNIDIDNDILPSLRTLTSLKFLDLSHTSLNGNFPANEISALENLEMLDLSYCGLIGGFETQQLAYLTNLGKLDFSNNRLDGTPNVQACNSLSRLQRLEWLNLSYNNFNKSIISCLSALPSLKILGLSYSTSLGSSFPVQEFHDLPNLEVILLRYNGFSGTLPMEAFASFHHLEVLDLSYNNFGGSVPLEIRALSSLKAVSFAYNKLNGSLSDHGLCELKNLHELDLRNNMLDGILPHCLNNLSSLELLDISLNQFTGILPLPFIANLTSLKYIYLSHNKFEGSFSFSSLSNHTKLVVVGLRSDNDKFEVETEEPINWIPKFQLEVLELSNCNINRREGHVVPGFLVHQHKLRVVDMNDNSLKGQFPNWLIKNNTNLEVLLLRNNSFSGVPLYRSVNLLELDISGNHLIGAIPNKIPKFFPNINCLNMSRNALNGSIPSSIGDLSELSVLDLSDNELSGEVPNGLFTNLSRLRILRLSRNKLHGQVLSRNLSMRDIERVHLDNNHFTGGIGAKSKGKLEHLTVLDISNNFFIGLIPDWISNMSELSELVVRNNSFKGRFPCGATPFSFLDISQNSFFGPIPSCLNFQKTKHLHLGSNRFTGLILNFFRDLKNVETLDIGNNNLSGTIPKFLGELSNLRILVLSKNKFSGSIPKQLCHLSKVSLIDLSNNFLSGSIPSCLQNIIGPSHIAILPRSISSDSIDTNYGYESVLGWSVSINFNNEAFETQDEVQFTTKSLSLPYKGDILYYMAGLDLSSNKLTGEIPEELGVLCQIRALNLSHNQLIGPIPVNFSNLANIESLDLSSNGLSGEVPSELIKLTYLETFNVSHNNLSGTLPEMKSQFSTFTKASYEGNPFLCGPPLEKKCTIKSQVNDPFPRGEEEYNEKWYDIDMACFYGSSSSTVVVFLLGFVALLYVNPYWRRRWLDFVEECMYKCYYFLYDLVRKPCMIFRK